MQGHELIFDLCKRVFQEAEFEPNVAFVGSNSSTIVEMVGKGLGTSLLMKRPALQTCMMKPNVKVVDIVPLVQSDIVLTYLNDMKMLPARQMFLKHMEKMRKDPE
jgi:DNA-binding transcriptional LysR family regulator